LKQLKMLGNHRAFIQVDGYTDSTGNEDHNLELSKDVRPLCYIPAHKLADKLPGKAFQSHGHGSQDPVASNATAEGKAQNRRLRLPC